MNLIEADKQAIALGAVKHGTMNYPKKTFRYDAGPFARYYFNADGKEVGHVIIDLMDLKDTISSFQEPREWSEINYSMLDRITTFS